MNKILKWIYGILGILVILQSAYFAVELIQFSDMKLFRLLVGFIGLGLLIVIPVFSIMNFEPEDIRGFRKYIPVIAMCWNVIFPWLPLFTARMRYGSFQLSIVPDAALALSAAVGGSAVNMVLIAVKNPDEAGRGLVIARWSITLACLFMALNIFFPAFSRFIADLGMILGFESSALASFTLRHGGFWHVIYTQIDNGILWMLEFALGLWSSMKFYKSFF